MEQYGVAFQVFRELVLSLLGKHFANTLQRTYKVAIYIALLQIGQISGPAFAK
jgi:hypothetical protein